MSFFKADKKIEAPIRSTGCASCGLANGLLHPKMEPTGEGQRKVLVIAEAPGEEEDKKGTQLIGKVGQRVRKTFRELGVDLDRDCRKTNACRCRPVDQGKNRKPTPDEIASCRHHVFEEIRRFQPNLILLLGECAVKSVLGERWVHNNDFSIGRWRGLTIPDQELGAWVCPTFHPSYVEREEWKTSAVDIIWKRDLERAFSLIDIPLPPKPDPELNFISGKHIRELLLGFWQKGKASQIVQESTPYFGLKPGTREWMICWRKYPDLQQRMLEYNETGKLPSVVSHNKPLTLFFDYETTGLKPYHQDHRIVACSIADSPERSWAWMWEDMDREMIVLFRELMLLWQVRKGGANNKFETVWSRQKLGHIIHNWWWDTTVAAHVIDNRKGNASLAFQAYTRLGILGFKDDTDQYLKAEDSNAFNKIHLIPKPKLLKRNAEDSAFEFAVCLSQREEMGYER